MSSDKCEPIHIYLGRGGGGKVWCKKIALLKNKRYLLSSPRYPLLLGKRWFYVRTNQVKIKGFLLNIFNVLKCHIPSLRLKPFWAVCSAASKFCWLTAREHWHKKIFIKPKEIRLRMPCGCLVNKHIAIMVNTFHFPIRWLLYELLNLLQLAILRNPILAIYNSLNCPIWESSLNWPFWEPLFQLVNFKMHHVSQF